MGDEAKSSPSRRSSWQLSRIAQYDLKFKASVFAGFSPDNDILIADKNDPKSFLYLFHFNGETYEEVWNKLIPPGFKGCCDKVMSQSGDIFLQQCEDAVTVKYTKALQQVESSHYKGEMLDCMEDGRAIYASGTMGESDWKIEVWRGGDKKPELVLAPRAGEVWKEWISICMVNGYVAVAENDSRSLDLFSEQGKHIFHKSLPFFPSLKKAVTSLGTRHILVAELKPAALHVYTLAGEEVAMFDREQLGLQPNIRLLGIRYSNTSVLHVAAGGFGCIASLIAFKVSNRRMAVL